MKKSNLIWTNLLKTTLFTPSGLGFINTWESDLTDKIKWEFFPAVTMFVLLYGWSTWNLMKHLEKKLDGNYIKMLLVLDKFWKQYSTKQCAATCISFCKPS